jgi:hypothetical protein
VSPAEVPADLVEKARRAFAGTVRAEWGGPGTEWSITIPEDAMRQALAAVLPEVQEQAWDAGADVAAGAAVILGRAPKDLPERARGHNPHRAAIPGADQ